MPIVIPYTGDDLTVASALAALTGYRQQEIDRRNALKDYAAKEDIQTQAQVNRGRQLYEMQRGYQQQDRAQALARAQVIAQRAKALNPGWQDDPDRAFVLNGLEAGELSVEDASKAMRAIDEHRTRAQGQAATLALRQQSEQRMQEQAAAMNGFRQREADRKDAEAGRKQAAGAALPGYLRGAFPDMTPEKAAATAGLIQAGVRPDLPEINVSGRSPKTPAGDLWRAEQDYAAAKKYAEKVAEDPLSDSGTRAKADFRLKVAEQTVYAIKSGIARRSPESSSQLPLPAPTAQPPQQAASKPAAPASGGGRPATLRGPDGKTYQVDLDTWAQAKRELQAMDPESWQSMNDEQKFSAVVEYLGL